MIKRSVYPPLLDMRWLSSTRPLSHIQRALVEQLFIRRYSFINKLFFAASMGKWDTYIKKKKRKTLEKLTSQSSPTVGKKLLRASSVHVSPISGCLNDLKKEASRRECNLKKKPNCTVLYDSNSAALKLPHDLFLECSPCNQSVNVYNLLLSNTMSSVHGLKRWSEQSRKSNWSRLPNQGGEEFKGLVATYL